MMLSSCSGRPAAGSAAAGCSRAPAASAALAPARAARARRAAPPRLAPPRAADGEKPAGGVDWDEAWSVFRRRVRSNVDINPGGPSAAPRPLSSRPRRLAQDDIRRDERLLLDVWSSQWFQALMVLVTLAIFYGFLKVGPPPPDGRCTLPWC